MSTGLDLRFPDLCDKNRVVFQLHIFDLRKLTIIDDNLNNSRDFIIQLWGTWPIKGFSVIYPCHMQVLVFKSSVPVAFCF